MNYTHYDDMVAEDLARQQFQLDRLPHFREQHPLPHVALVIRVQLVRRLYELHEGWEDPWIGLLYKILSYITFNVIDKSVKHFFFY